MMNALDWIRGARLDDEADLGAGPVADEVDGAVVVVVGTEAVVVGAEVVDVARAADELGYDGMGIPDHVVNLETLATPYPYTKDGSRRWEPFTHWPDPWVTIGAVALATRRLKFVTTVYLPAMRTASRSVSRTKYAMAKAASSAQPSIFETTWTSTSAPSRARASTP